MLHAATHVWWDLDACPPPEDCDCSMIAQYITHALQVVGCSDDPSIHTYGDKVPLNERALTLQRIATHFLWLSDGFGELSMRNHLAVWPKMNRLPANHLIITKNFQVHQSALSVLQEHGCSILLAYPDGDEDAIADFVPTLTYRWKLSKLLCGGPPDGFEEPTYPYEPVDLEMVFPFPCPDMPIEPPSCLDLDLLVDANTSVWWDIDSCPVPIHCDAATIPDNISYAVGGGPLTIFTDTSRISSPTWIIFCYSKLEFKFVPARYTSEDMIDLMRKWAERNPPPATCLLISGDERFDSILDELRDKGYRIFLAHPDGGKQVSLASKADFVWEWSELSHGIGPYSGYPPTPSSFEDEDWIDEGNSDFETKEEEDFEMKGEPADYESKEEDYEKKSGRKRCRTCGSDLGGVSSMVTV